MSDRFKLIAFPILALLLGLQAGYFIGHWQGFDDGATQQKAAVAITEAKEAVKATKQRDLIDDETRKIPDTHLDAALAVGGWLRD